MGKLVGILHQYRMKGLTELERPLTKVTVGILKSFFEGPMMTWMSSCVFRKSKLYAYSPHFFHGPNESLIDMTVNFQASIDLVDPLCNLWDSRDARAPVIRSIVALERENLNNEVQSYTRAKLGQLLVGYGRFVLRRSPIYNLFVT
jgi:hypothetical protein